MNAFAGPQRRSFARVPGHVRPQQTPGHIRDKRGQQAWGTMDSPSDQWPHQSHSSVRRDARLDVKTHHGPAELAPVSCRSRAAVLRQVRTWGGDRDEAPSPVRHLFLPVTFALHRQA
jgi:hypothetical protein